MGKKRIVSVTYENERISIKKTAYLTKTVCYVSPVWSLIERKQVTLQPVKRP